jgi:hypothetical protein
MVTANLFIHFVTNANYMTVRHNDERPSSTLRLIDGGEHAPHSLLGGSQSTHRRVVASSYTDGFYQVPLLTPHSMNTFILRDTLKGMYIHLYYIR